MAGAWTGSIKKEIADAWRPVAENACYGLVGLETIAGVSCAQTDQARWQSQCPPGFGADSSPDAHLELLSAGEARPPGIGTSGALDNAGQRRAQ